MAPNTIPGICIGYYEDISRLSKDYVVISLALLGDAKSYPNDRNSWRFYITANWETIFQYTARTSVPAQASV